MELYLKVLNQYSDDEMLRLMLDDDEYDEFYENIYIKMA